MTSSARALCYPPRCFALHVSSSAAFTRRACYRKGVGTPFHSFQARNSAAARAARELARPISARRRSGGSPPVSAGAQGRASSLSHHTLLRWFRPLPQWRLRRCSGEFSPQDYHLARHSLLFEAAVADRVSLSWPVSAVEHFAPPRFAADTHACIRPQVACSLLGSSRGAPTARAVEARVVGAPRGETRGLQVHPSVRARRAVPERRLFALTDESAAMYVARI